MAEPIQCPKCSSTQITAQETGFSVEKAAAGAILTGGIGLLAGLHGSSNVNVVCLNCGHKWNPKEYADQQARSRAIANENYTAMWKAKFYEAYESGNMEQAAGILDIQRNTMFRAKGLEGMYKHLKSEDTIAMILKIIVLTIFAVIVIWFVSCIT